MARYSLSIIIKSEVSIGNEKTQIESQVRMACFFKARQQNWKNIYTS